MNRIRPYRFALVVLILPAVAFGLGFTPQDSLSPQPSPEVNALLQRGRETAKSDRAEAARLMEEAVKTAQQMGDAPGQAAACFELGAMLRRQAPPKAVGYFNQALEIYSRLGDKRGQARCLTGVGNAYAIMSQQDKAVEHLEAGRKLSMEVGYQEGVAAALNGIGMVYARTGQPRRALPYFQESRAIYETAGKPDEVFGIVSNIAVCHGMSGDVPRAIEVLQEALTVIRGKGLEGDEGVILTNLGVAHSRVGDLRKSSEYLREAIPLLEKSGIRKSVATCFIALANNSRKEGNLFESLACAQRAYDLQVEVQDSANAANALLAMGGFYTTVGDQDRAIDCYRRALKTNEGTGDIVGRMHMLNGLGQLLGKLGKLKEEQSCYQEVLQLQERAEDSDTKARAYLYMAESQKRGGRYNEAVAHTREALALFQRLQSPGGEADCERQLGELQRLTGNRLEAGERFRRALEINQAIGNVDAQAACLAAIANVTDSASEKEKRLAEALKLIEGMRESLGVLGESKAAYLEDQASIYQNYLRYLLGAKKYTAAFEWVQRSKARVLIDLLASGQVDVTSVMSARDRAIELALAQRGKKLNVEWMSNEGERAELARRADSPADRVRAAKDKREEIEAAQKELERDWRASRDRFYARNPQVAYRRGARVAEISEIAAGISADTAILEFCFTPADGGSADKDQLALFLVSKEKGKPVLRVFREFLSPGEIGRLASAFREACANRPGSAGARMYQDLARRLYRTLLSSAAPNFASKKRLVICPDGPLWDVPFQALLAPSGSPSETSKAEFLFERFSLAYGYSATGVKAALDSRMQPNRTHPTNPLLVMASPDFSGEDGGAGREDPRTVSRRHFERGGGLSPLPYSREEARMVSGLFPGSIAKMGREAQEALVKEKGRDYRYLHFATHALVNDAAPMLSGVVLANPPANSIEDGILSVRELFEMRLSADMIVFSACNTARGARRRGEGVVGLTWASLASGIPTQVVSQWSVDDETTAALMGRFYREIKSGKPKDASLRAAALATMRDGKHSHPFYWAPFILNGDWR